MSWCFAPLTPQESHKMDVLHTQKRLTYFRNSDPIRLSRLKWCLSGLWCPKNSWQSYHTKRCWKPRCWCIPKSACTAFSKIAHTILLRLLRCQLCLNRYFPFIIRSMISYTNDTLHLHSTARPEIQRWCFSSSIWCVILKVSYFLAPDNGHDSRYYNSFIILLKLCCINVPHLGVCWNDDHSFNLWWVLFCKPGLFSFLFYVVTQCQQFPGPEIARCG